MEAAARRGDRVAAIAELEASIIPLDRASGIDIGWNDAQRIWESALVDIKRHLVPTVWPEFEARIALLRRVVRCNGWTLELPFRGFDRSGRSAALNGMALVLAEIRDAPMDSEIKQELVERVKHLGGYWDQKKPDLVRWGMEMVDTVDRITELRGTRMPAITANRVMQGLVVAPLAVGPAAGAVCLIPIIGQTVGLGLQILAAVVIVGGIVIIFLFSSSDVERAFGTLKRKRGTKPAKDLVDEVTKDLDADEKKELKDALGKNIEKIEKLGFTAGDGTPFGTELEQLKEIQAEIN